MVQQPGIPSPPTAWPPPPPPPEAWQYPVRVEPVPGSPYVLAILGPPVVTAGQAVGALVAGLAAVTVALAMGCTAAVVLTAEESPWGVGAFAVLATVLGVAAILLGVAGIRRTGRRPPAHPQPWSPGVAGPPAASSGEIVVVRKGRGLAVSGLVCGATGLFLTVVTLLVTVVLAVA